MENYSSYTIKRSKAFLSLGPKYELFDEDDEQLFLIEKGMVSGNWTFYSDSIAKNEEYSLACSRFKRKSELTDLETGEKTCLFEKKGFLSSKWRIIDLESNRQFEARHSFWSKNKVTVYQGKKVVAKYNLSNMLGFKLKIELIGEELPIDAALSFAVNLINYVYQQSRI